MVIVVLRQSTSAHTLPSSSLMYAFTKVAWVTTVLDANAATTARRSASVARPQSTALCPLISYALLSPSVLVSPLPYCGCLVRVRVRVRVSP